MIQLMGLSAIGIIAGILLALYLKVVQLVTGNQAYELLYATDYIPFLQDLRPSFLAGGIFHNVFCIVSVIALFYLLKFIGFEKKMLPYFLVYTIGSAMLFSLTALSEHTPAITDFSAWMHWIVGHVIYSAAVAVLIKRWL